MNSRPCPFPDVVFPPLLLSALSSCLLPPFTLVIEESDILESNGDCLRRKCGCVDKWEGGGMLMSRDVMENVFGVFSIMPDCNGTCVEFASDSLECSGTSRWFLFVGF